MVNIRTRYSSPIGEKRPRELMILQHAYWYLHMKGVHYEGNMHAFEILCNAIIEVVNKYKRIAYDNVEKWR